MGNQMTMVSTFHGYVVKCPSVCNNTYKAFCNQLSNHCTEIPVSRELSLFSSIINKTETKPISTYYPVRIKDLLTEV